MHHKLKTSSMGFNLIEVLIVSSLLSIAFLVFLGALSSSKSASSLTKIGTTKNIILNNMSEIIRSKRFDEQTDAPWSSVIGAEEVQEYHLNLDGSNDYVVLPDMSYLNDYSFSGWIKIHTRNTWERFFDFGKGGAGDMFLSVMGGRTGGNLEMTIHPNGGNYTINGGTTLQDGNWHNVIFTFDKGGDGMKLYIDGVLVGSNVYNTTSFSDWGSGQNFYIGKANWNDPYLDAEIGQISIYNTAISSSTVGDIYLSGRNTDLRNVNSAQESMIGYWRMDEGSGTILYDKMNNAGNATLFNGVLWEAGSYLESNLAQFDDVDDFDGYVYINDDLYPNYVANVQVDYVDLAGKFRAINSYPTDYKRIVIMVEHPGTTSISDTIIVGTGL